MEACQAQDEELGPIDLMDVHTKTALTEPARTWGLAAIAWSVWPSIQDRDLARDAWPGSGLNAVQVSMGRQEAEASTQYKTSTGRSSVGAEIRSAGVPGPGEPPHCGAARPACGGCS